MDETTLRCGFNRRGRPGYSALSKDGGPISELVDEKHRLGETTFLTIPTENHGCRIDITTPEQFDVEMQFGVDSYCNTYSSPTATALDNGLVDPELRWLR